MADPVTFTDAQRRTIAAGFADIDRRLKEMEAALVEAADESPFGAYQPDLTPAEIEALRGAFDRIRKTMLAWLDAHAIAPAGQRTSLRWALRVRLSALGVALADMGVGHLRGYGPVSDEVAAAAARIQEDLARLIETIGARLRTLP